MTAKTFTVTITDSDAFAAFLGNLTHYLTEADADMTRMRRSTAEPDAVVDLVPFVGNSIDEAYAALSELRKCLVIDEVPPPLPLSCTYLRSDKHLMTHSRSGDPAIEPHTPCALVDWQAYQANEPAMMEAYVAYWKAAQS